MRDSIFGDCFGAELGKGVVEVQCADLQTFYVARYDADVTERRCRSILQQLFDDAEVRSRSSLPLGSPSFAYSLTGISAQWGDTDGLGACAPHRDRGLSLFLAQGGISMDSSEAAEAVTVLAYDGLPPDRISPRRPAEIPFLGRTFSVHSSCTLKGARNLACYPNGQMNWGRFSSMERARQAQQLQADVNRTSANAVIADTTMACTFESVDTECRGVAYRATGSTIGASNVLVVYYATATVRGVPAQVACSFYTDQASGNGLSPLCRDVLAVPGAPALLNQVTE